MIYETKTKSNIDSFSTFDPTCCFTGLKNNWLITDTESQSNEPTIKKFKNIFL